ncbi:MAG TPA: hypothetical protein VK929_00120, partial [Longimicrobiales bacterium]|nr:hypothetical protein [Longimicrobiales bacterium]
ATPVEFFMLPAAGTLLKDLMPDDAEGGVHRDLVDQVTALLFQSFRFWLHGRFTWELTGAAAATVLSAEGPPGSDRVDPPEPAGYVQLPRNLLWARVAEDAPAEPVDGFFFSAPTDSEGGPPGRLDLLLALGVRPGRPGISTVDVSIEGDDMLQHWADVDARPGGTDFGNVLPGGELQGYHSLTTRAEVLKLAARCFRLMQTADGQEVEGTDGRRRLVDG